MGKHYEWRCLSSDGLLREPVSTGPYYDESRLENHYISEDEAVKDLELFAQVGGKFANEGSWLLLTIYD